MTTTVTSHSTSIHVATTELLTVKTSDPSIESSTMTRQSSVSLSSSPLSVTGMSGLLNSRNLVQDEKLVVATLATFDSGNPSNLIKQDLKWIIQSRRKAEGKGELQVEFKKPVRDELTSEELTKRARRRELNRLAARRSREKGQKKKDKLVEEIRQLQHQNTDLMKMLGSLTEQRNGIIDKLRQHMKQCSDYSATKNAAVGLSERVLQMLGFSPASLSSTPKSLITEAFAPESTTVEVKVEKYPYSASCPSSPVVVGLDRNLVHSSESESTFSPLVYPGSPTSVFPKGSCSPGHSSFEQPLASPSISSHNKSVDRSTLQSVEDCAIIKKPVEDSNFTKPLMRTDRGHRVFLERSYSFPSSSNETRTVLELSSSNSSLLDFTCPDASVPVAHGPYFGKSSSSVITSAMLAPTDEQESPLDLVVRRKTSFREQIHERSSLEPWTVPGHSEICSRSPVSRRWSVDESATVLSQPLNLSSKNSAFCSDEQFNLSHNDNAGSSSSSTKYSPSFVDSYS